MKFPMIIIPEKNDFIYSITIPNVQDLTLVEDLHVYISTTPVATIQAGFTINGNAVKIPFRNLNRGYYNLWVTFKIDGQRVSYNYKNAIQIVEWNNQYINWLDYKEGSEIAVQAGVCIIVNFSEHDFAYLWNTMDRLQSLKDDCEAAAQEAHEAAEYAKQEGDFAKEQGEEAEKQAEYAKEQGGLAEQVVQRANTAAKDAEDAAKEAEKQAKDAEDAARLANEAREQLTTTFNEKLAELDADYSRVKNELDADYVAVKAQLDAEYSRTKAQLDAEYASAIANINNRMSAIETDWVAMAENISKEFEDSMLSWQGRVDNLLAQFTATFNASEAQRDATFQAKEAKRDEATATIEQEAQKLNDLSQEIFDETENTLSPTSASTKSTIPQIDGSLVSGGTSNGSFDFDLTGLVGKLLIETNYNPVGSQFANAVIWCLYSGERPSADTFIEASEKLGDGTYEGEIDLSAYPTAKLIRVTTSKSTPHVVAINKNKSSKIEDLEARVTALEDEVPVVLPDVIHVVKGERVQIFHRGTVEAVNPYNYSVNPICSSGKSYPRYLHFEGSSSIVGQSLPLSMQIMDSKSNVIGIAESVIKVIPPMSNPSTMKNVLLFGASTLGTGSITNELRRRLVETSGTVGDRSNPKGLGLSNIQFVGRKVGSVYGDIHQEATGGWSWLDYTSAGRAAVRFQVYGVTQLNMGDTYSDGSHTFTIAEINVTDGIGNIRCLGASTASAASGTLTKVGGSGDDAIQYYSFESEYYSPFFVNGQIDFAPYANSYCDGHIDVLISFCGTNDIFGDRTITQVYENSIKPFVRKYHQQFPNGKFILSTLQLPDMNGGMGASYGASATSNYWTMARRFFEFARLAYEMAELDEFRGYVSIANCLQLVDAENIYQYKDLPVCNRMPDVTERMGLNGVHPAGSSSSDGEIIGGSEAGTKSIADAIYQTFNALSL